MQDNLVSNDSDEAMMITSNFQALNNQTDHNEQ